MKFIEKDIYGDWDSPHTFCRYQLDDEEYGFLCTEKVFDDDADDPMKCKCLFSPSNANDCNKFEFHKHDKNPDAKRYKGKKYRHE